MDTTTTMASLPRRKRGLVFKILLAIPVLWFAFIGLAVMTGNHDDTYVGNPRFQGQREVAPDNHPPDTVLGNQGNVVNMNHGDDSALQAPVIEKPNPDRLRFEEKMRKDAAEELRLSQERRRVEKMAENARTKGPTVHQEHHRADNVAPPVGVRKHRISMEEVKKNIPTAAPGSPGNKRSTVNCYTWM